MSYSYVSLQELRDGLDIKQRDLDDAQLLRIGRSVSRTIDKLCGRTFRIENATRIYSPSRVNTLKIDDLLELTSIKTDHNYDEVYEETWATTDYHLEPLNAPLKEEPYTRIRLRTGGTKYFPYMYERSVEIVGKWGYWEELESIAATVDGNVLVGGTSIILTDASELSAGNTILIGSEQLYISHRDTATKTLTVQRGVNQTTPAAISNGATIQVYRYPEPVTSATQMLANRYHARLKTPLGMVNVPGDIGWRAIYIPKKDMDVIEMIRHYQKESWFA